MLERECFFRPRSIDELTSYLKSEGIQLDNWGTGNAKTVANLFRELSEGEVFLVKTPEGLVRKLAAANVRVYFQEANGQVLYLKEQKQIFKDGRERIRDHMTWSIAEKIHPGEDILAAVKRALQEELNITDEIVLIGKGRTVNNVNSFSYPGIKSQYVSHAFEAFLSLSQFKPNGYIEEQVDKTSYWQWVRAE